jgi:hypothetical protein
MKESRFFDFQFVEGETHFNTSWHAEMSLILDEPI